MAIQNKLAGGISNVLADVDATNNLKVTLPQVLAQSGYDRNMSEVDAGGVLGEAKLLAGEVSEDYRLRVEQDHILGQEVFNGAAQNTGISSLLLTTMTAGFTGALVTNASNITTLNTGFLYQSRQLFPIFSGSQTYCYTKIKFTGTWAVTNTTIDVGLFAANTAVPYAPTDGVFIRANNTGLFGVCNVNGTEQTTQAFKVAFGGADFVPTIGVAYDVIITSSSRVVVFWMDIQDGKGFQIFGKIGLSTSTRRPIYGGSTPFSVRHSIAATAASGVINLNVVEYMVSNGGFTNMRSEQSTTAILTGGQQGQQGHTQGSTSLFTNSLAAGAGVAMTNTTAALGVGLGGQFSALPTLAAPTTGIVCSYQNPAPSTVITGKQLVITGVKIEAVVTTVLAGNATPIIYALGLAYGHTNVSLATAEGAATKAPRTIPLGIQTFAAAAAVGATAQVINVKFDRAIPVYPSEFVAVTAKNLGAVTTTGVVTFLVTYDYGWVL
jgi:hypothetical protein